MSGLDLFYIDAELIANAKQSNSKEKIYERTTMHKEAEDKSKARLTLAWNLFGTTAGIILVLHAALKGWSSKRAHCERRRFNSVSTLFERRNRITSVRIFEASWFQCT